jgi:Zn-dependent protease with chaperone function
MKLIFSFILALSIFACSTPAPSPEDIGVAVIQEAKSQLFKKNEFQDIENWKPLQNDKARKYVTEIGNRVLAKSSVSSVEFIVIDTPLVQAISSSSGEIYVSRGMLNFMQSEAELACLLAHEIAHQEQRSQEETPQKGLSNTRRRILEATLPESLRRVGISEDLEDIAYARASKEREKSADEAGLRLCEKAGYNPRALPSLLARLSKNITNGVLVRIQKLKGSHERLQDRANHLFTTLGARRVGNLVDGHSRYQRRLSSLIPSDPPLTPEQRNILSELKNFEEEALQTNRTHKISLKRYLAIAQRISAIIRDNHVTYADLYAEISFPSANGAFMEERVLQLYPAFGGFSAQLRSQISETLTALSRVGIGFVPYVGSSIDFYELVTGNEFFTGEPISTMGRALCAVGMVVGAGSTLRTFEKALAREAVLTGDVSEAITWAQRISKESRINRVVRYNPLNPGPLHRMQVAPGGAFVSDTFRSGSYSGVINEDPIKLYRTYSTDDRQLGSFWTTQKPTGPFQATIDSAIDPAWGNTPRMWIEIEVPRGQTLYVGQAAAVRPGMVGAVSATLPGGGSQVFIERVDSSWIIEKGRF